MLEEEEAGEVRVGEGGFELRGDVDTMQDAGEVCSRLFVSLLCISG